MLQVKKIALSFFTIFALIVSDCTVHPKLTPMQENQITTRAIEAEYEDTYLATLAIIQDEDYKVREKDMKKGVIVADLKTSIVEKIGGCLVGRLLDAAFTSLFGAADETTTTEQLSSEIICSIARINDTSSKVCINIYERTRSKTEYRKSDDVKTEQYIELVCDETIYQNLFNKIIAKVKKGKR